MRPHLTVRTRPVPGYPSVHAGRDGHLYVAYRDQRLRLPDRVHKHVGYREAKLTAADGSGGGVYVHHAVMLAFCGPVPEGCEIRFKNGDKTDCRPANLEYAPTERNKLAGQDVRRWHERFTSGQMTCTEIAARLGVTVRNVGAWFERHGLSTGRTRHTRVEREEFDRRTARLLSAEPGLSVREMGRRLHPDMKWQTAVRRVEAALARLKTGNLAG